MILHLRDNKNVYKYFVNCRSMKNELCNIMSFNYCCFIDFETNFIY